MSIEIELKFLVNPDAVTELPGRLAHWQPRNIAPVTLTNCYFETPDQKLRGWDMGLRIRGVGDQYEMTLKTAGQVVGGLHQRPEYNISLQQPTLDLHALPAEVWPADCDVEQLQQQLQPLFSTDFCRQRWLVTVDESVIEVALDQGSITAQHRSEPLCELELELISGERDDLFQLAQALTEQPGLRLGSQSKAARGYRLAKGETPPLPAALYQPKLAAKLSVEQGLEGMLNMLLTRWQHYETLWLNGDAASAYQLQQTLLAIRETFALFGGVISRPVSSQLRSQLQLLESQIAEQAALQVGYSPLNSQAQLALLRLLVEKQWRGSVNSRQQDKLNGSFKRFCDQMLSRYAAELKSWAAQPLSAQELPQSEIKVTKLILGIQLLAAAYDETELRHWLAPWQQGLELLRTQQLSTLETQRSALTKVRPFWLASDKI